MRIEFSPDEFKVALATSVVVFGFDGENLKTLVAKKVGSPFEGAWIIPSSVVRAEEDPAFVAKELLSRITGKDNWLLEKLNGFAEPYRNPVGRVINIAYYCTIRLDDALENNLKKEGYSWVSVSDIPRMAYDHNEIMEYAKERLKRRVKRRPIGFSLLPAEFTLNNIQRLYECALGKAFDKRNFRRKLLKSQLLLETENFIRSSERAKRPSRLYRFNEKKYRTLTLKGYDFVYQ
jgi:8-oxo-dGTP diphosphatase